MSASLLFHKELLKQSVLSQAKGSHTTAGTVNSAEVKAFWNMATMCDSDPLGQSFGISQLINQNTTYMLSFQTYRNFNINDCAHTKAHTPNAHNRGSLVKFYAEKNCFQAALQQTKK